MLVRFEPENIDAAVDFVHRAQIYLRKEFRDRGELIVRVSDQQMHALSELHGFIDAKFMRRAERWEAPE